MTQIIAEGNLIVRAQPDDWQLVRMVGDELRVLAEVTTDHIFRYNGDLRDWQQLPDDGVISPDQIEEVALGWSSESKSWQMGLVLREDAANRRGNRWIELARWVDMDGQTIKAATMESAESLSMLLGVPFRMIPPKLDGQRPPLQELPLRFGLWMFTLFGDSAETYQFKLSPVWKRRSYRRLVWYSFWVVIYFVLSFGTLTSDLALPNAGTLLPNPQFLPYLGVATGIVLLGLVFYTLYQIRAQPDRIILDPKERSIRAYSGKSLRWFIDSETADSVYVSEVIRRKDRTYRTYHGEINLYLKDGKFHYVLDQGGEELNSEEVYRKPMVDRIFLLSPETVNTDLQAAALYIAAALGVPCWYDVRVK